MSAPREGDVVAGRYRLERPLGKGGMGVVWAAKHLVTHKSLALKLILEKHDDPAARRRFLREARAASAVSHPNVVTVHDVLEGDDGTPILVMDLLRGESLAARLSREHVLPVKEALAIVRDVLLALEAAHAVGVVHRDLKPDNVFLLEGGAVRILDFGIAKLRGSDAATKETNRLTATGAMIGTPHYMAPEQAFGEEDVDLRADLWAVGAVLHECLAGAPPVDGQNLGQILKALATGHIPALRERVPDAPAEVAAVVDRLLAIERAARPGSARQVIDAIDAVGNAPATTLPVVATSPAAQAETPQPVRAPRRRWLVPAAGLVALAASSFFLLGSPARAPDRVASAAAAPLAPVSAPEPAFSAAEPVAPLPAPSASVSARPAPKRARPAPPSSAAAKPGPLLEDPPF